MKKFNLLLTGGLLCASLLSFSQDKKHSKEKKSKSGAHGKKTEATKAPTTSLNNQIDSVSYSLGINIASNLKKQGFDTLNAELVGKAIADSYKNAGKLDENTAQSYLMGYFQEMQKSKLDKNLKAGEKFLEENKKKPGVVTLPSGLQYMIIKEGTGPIPTSSDKVTTHYHGTLIDGTVFDSSVERGQPATFPVNGVIPGWVEALQLMPVGSKWKLFIPANLAYGERGAGGKIGPNSVLIFDIELLSIEGK